MSYFLPDTSVEGLRLITQGDWVALECYPQIRDILVNRLSAEVADLLAEPDTENGFNYSWTSIRTGTVKPFESLKGAERQQLITVTNNHLSQIQKLGEALEESGNRDERSLGSILRKISEIPQEKWDQWLFSVDGKPVFVNWGIEVEAKKREPGLEQFGQKVTELPARERTFRWPSLHSLWWLVFIALCIIIFGRLIDGCGFFRVLGVVPNYCKGETTPIVEQLERLKEERETLEKTIYTLSEQLVVAPICGIGTPAFAPTGEKELLPDKVIKSIPNLPADPGAASSKALSYHQAINDLLRDSGAEICDGIELLAFWEASVDIDLVMYCPINDTDVATASIPESRVVGPYNLQGCGAKYDMESDGEGGEGPYFERICISDQAEVGDYLLTVIHQDDSGNQQPVAVRLISRFQEQVDEMIIKSKPGGEAEDFFPITFVP